MKKTPHKKKKTVFSKIIYIGVGVLLVFFLVGIVKEFVKKVELEKEITTLEEDLERLQMDKETFLTSIESYKSDFFLEQEAREKFNLVKKGEKVVVIPNSETYSQQDYQVNQDGKIVLKEQISAEDNNLKNWWTYFFGDKKIN